MEDRPIAIPIIFSLPRSAVRDCWIHCRKRPIHWSIQLENDPSSQRQGPSVPQRPAQLTRREPAGVHLVPTLDQSLLLEGAFGNFKALIKMIKSDKERYNLDQFGVSLNAPTICLGSSCIEPYHVATTPITRSPSSSWNGHGWWSKNLGRIPLFSSSTANSEINMFEMSIVILESDTMTDKFHSRKSEFDRHF